MSNPKDWAVEAARAVVNSAVLVSDGSVESRDRCTERFADAIRTALAGYAVLDRCHAATIRNVLKRGESVIHIKGESELYDWNAALQSLDAALAAPPSPRGEVKAL